MAAESSGELGALIEAMFLVASADGTFSIAERRHFMDMAASLSDDQVDSTALLAVVQEAEAQLEAQGLAARLKSVAERLPDETARRLALGLATQLALIDGIVDSERAILDAMADAFALSETEQEDIAASVTFASTRRPLVEED